MIPPKKLSLSQILPFLIFSIILLLIVIVFTIYDDNIYNPYANESCLLKSINQKNLDLRIMARLENLSTV